MSDLFLLMLAQRFLRPMGLFLSMKSQNLPVYLVTTGRKIIESRAAPITDE